MHTRQHALLSEDGLHRHRLSRTWASHDKPSAFIGANPSTSDAATDDPTIREMTALAQHGAAPPYTWCTLPPTGLLIRATSGALCAHDAANEGCSSQS